MRKPIRLLSILTQRACRGPGRGQACRLGACEQLELHAGVGPEDLGGELADARAVLATDPVQLELVGQTQAQQTTGGFMAQTDQRLEPGLEELLGHLGF